MADFVAVIRRAVDGLSDNNPEMRLKVYEKARGAVRRQLEAMNPRPSDDLIKRQLDKLEAAIDDVESEHAEALPAEELPPEPVAEVEPEAVEPEPIPAEEPPPAEETAEPAEAEEPQHHEEPEAVQEPEPVVEETAVEEVYEAPAEEPFHEAETEEPQPVAEEPVWQEPEPAAEQPEDDYVPSWQTEEPVEVAAPDTAEPTADDQPPAEDEPQALDAAPQEGDASDPLADYLPAEDERRDNTLPPAETLGWEWPEERPAELEQQGDEPAAKASEWGDLDALIGGAPRKPETDEPAAQAGIADAAPMSETASRGPQRSFRAEPRKSRFNLGALLAAVVLIGAAGGAGAAYWYNRDDVNAWVNGLVASATGDRTSETATTPAAETQTAGQRGLPETTPSTTAEERKEPATTEVAAVATGQDSSGKFTQRLLADGSEVDGGPAPSLDGTAEEGKSVAAQTTEETVALATGEEPATDGDAAATGDTPAVAPDTTTPAGAETTGTEGGNPAAEAGQPAIGVAQKMFLYEERLGQSSPTAIDGTVVWSSGEESPGGDAKPEPVVRAQISVPANGLTALITFRRNADQSLPASHIIEVVFSLPQSFEGGGIESVQRVAMKRTEQDRGDQLIAVPAKITDDFHMIALNDFPEAIAKNTELLRTRNWIDIPVTYRNGRRALITLDKGANGVEVFDRVMKAWAAQGAPNSQ